MFILILFLIFLGLSIPAIINEEEKSNDAKTIDNKYVLSRHPDHGLESTIINESTMSDFVIWEKYNHVNKRVDKEKLKLSKSGNKLSGEDCKVVESIKVYAIIFRDGTRANETWKQFEEWALKWMLADREERHKYLKERYPEWYDKWGNHQV